MKNILIILVVIIFPSCDLLTGKLTGNVLCETRYSTKADAGNQINIYNEKDLLNTKYQYIDQSLSSYRSNAIGLYFDLKEAKSKAIRDTITKIFDRNEKDLSFKIIEMKTRIHNIKLMADADGKFSTSLAPGNYLVIFTSNNKAGINYIDAAGFIGMETIKIEMFRETVLNKILK